MTGAKPVIPPIEGVSKETAIDAWKLLNFQVSILGGNVLVVGGGSVSCEVCEFLVHQSRGPMRITMIEMPMKQP